MFVLVRLKPFWCFLGQLGSSVLENAGFISNQLLHGLLFRDGGDRSRARHPEKVDHQQLVRYKACVLEHRRSELAQEAPERLQSNQNEHLEREAGNVSVFATKQIPAIAVIRKPTNQEAGGLQDCVPDFRQSTTRLSVISRYGNPVIVKDRNDRPAALLMHTHKPLTRMGANERLSSSSVK